jgi:hypothetical protein
MPKEDRDEMEQEDEIFGFLKQSHISEKNIARLKVLVSSENPRIAELASIALEVALVKPYKKCRLKMLAMERKDLLRKLDETGLILAHHKE